MAILTNSLVLIWMGLILGQTANAKTITSQQMLKQKNVTIYEEPKINTEKTTDWYANPIIVSSVNAKNKKPEVIKFVIESRGYHGAFNNNVQIDCPKPFQKSYSNLFNINY